MDLGNEVALVTGSGSGIGRGISLALAERGAKIIVNDLYLSKAKKVAQEINALERTALPIQADVIRKGEVDNMVALAIEKLGKISILVNNVGSFSAGKTIVEMEEEDWDKTIGLNLKGLYLCTHAVVKGMVERNKGKIINISSGNGLRGSAGQSHYCAAKFGVIGFSFAVAKELAPYKINVNAVCPGLMDTPMNARYEQIMSSKEGKTLKEFRNQALSNIPLGRIGIPKDVGNLVVFLASSESDYITGQAIAVGGGITRALT